MKMTVILAILAISTLSAQAGEKKIRLALMCFKSGEQTSGMNKICYYDCLGAQVAINVSSVSLCPLTIDR